MKTAPLLDPNWPPIIRAGNVPPLIRLRDTILTVVAWIFLVFLLWEILDMLWDYFSAPVFQLSRTHSLNLQAFLTRIGGFALLSLLLVLWLTFWGIVRRKELRRTYDPRPVSPLSLRDHAATFGILPETVERWRQYRSVMVELDASDHLERVAPKSSDPPPASAG
jgi:poly-beta-1,6-N-acetyl-D-glucosamine biosynthesis protein PgaD